MLQANHTTVARRITVMEDHIGSRLFDRSTTGLVLTQLGEDLMPYALRIENEMTSASRIIVGRDAQPAGTVYVTMPHGLAMTSIMDDLTAFSDTYPDIELDVHFTNDIADIKAALSEQPDAGGIEATMELFEHVLEEMRELDAGAFNDVHTFADERREAVA